MKRLTSQHSRFPSFSYTSLKASTQCALSFGFIRIDQMCPPVLKEEKWYKDVLHLKQIAILSLCVCLHLRLNVFRIKF